MERKSSLTSLNEANFAGHSLPAIIQEFLWKQTGPFIRPKFGKHHEASCIFCQNAHIHNDMKEACKIFEKVLVQNLSANAHNPVYKAIQKVPRWRIIESAFPHIVHCVSSFLQYRKDVMDLQTVSQTESKLLYILHWIILDAAEECADADYENGTYQTHPHYYFFPITSIMLFVYMLAPVLHRIKESELQYNRLENGLKLWSPLWDYRHPDAPCFTTYCKLNPHRLWSQRIRSRRTSFDVLPGRKISKDEKNTRDSPKSTGGAGFYRFDSHSKGISEQMAGNNLKASKTLVQKYSGEHTVILRLPTSVEYEDNKNSPVIFSGKATILQLTMGRNAVTAARASLPSEHLQLPPDMSQHMAARHSITTPGITLDTEITFEAPKPMKYSCQSAVKTIPLFAATFMDVAVLKCLFVPQWPEEGVFWALNFLFHRLQMMHRIKIEQQPRKRSNSLPVPKIEISFHDSPEAKKKSNKEYSSSDHKDSPFAMKKRMGRSQKHADKSKKKKKMVELKTFVESTGKLLLSKSEKNLDKLMQTDDKQLYDEEYRLSLESDDSKNLTYPTTSLTKMNPAEEGDEPSKEIALVKVTSMPSLSCLLDEQENQTKIGEEKHSFEKYPNPIITITQHTPNPSPDYLRRKHSFESFAEPEDGRVSKESKPPSLTRSLTDSNITYSSEETSEAAGSVGYVDKEGDIDIMVVLQAIHNICQREKNVCSIQVCEMMIRILELLMEMGILHQHTREDHVHKNSYLFSFEQFSSFRQTQKITDSQTLITSSVFRIIKHLGCPNHCFEGQKMVTTSSADLIRSQCQNVLTRLRRIHLEYFEKYLQTFVETSAISDILEFFHAFCGFCVDPCSLLSPNQKRNVRSPDSMTQGGYTTNFGAGVNNVKCGRGVEGQILMSTFKTLITRLTSTPKEIKAPENMSLYHDARLFVNYVKEAHGGIFRQVLLSGLIDTAMKAHRKEPVVQTTKVIRHISHPEQEMGQIDNACFVTDDRDSRKAVFKKRSTSSTGVSLFDLDVNEDGKATSPSNFKKKHPILTPRVSEKNLHNADLSKYPSRSPMGGLVNWLRKEYRRSESIESHGGDDSDFQLDASLTQQIRALHHSHSKMSQRAISNSMSHTLSKAKKRVGDHLNKFGLRKKKKNKSMEETQGSYLSRRNSIETGHHSRDSEYLILKERKLVSVNTLYSGMQRLAFILEICHPGSVPDPPLVAAVLDLPRTPVIARAAFLVECSYYVHCFNKGQWPLWTKLNLPGFRQSGAGPFTSTRGSAAPNGLRRAQLLQRSAGKMFHAWAEAIASRLEEMLNKDEENIPQVITNLSDESKQSELLKDDEEEDFLDEATGMDLSGQCPMALRIMACMLLLEITSYLRETFQNLPKSIRTMGRERPTAWEKSYMKDSNRRFSVALSSMGHSQASAQSLQSISCDREPKVEKNEEQRSKSDLQKQSSLKNTKINEKRTSNALNAFRKYAKHVMTAGEFFVNFNLPPL